MRQLGTESGALEFFSGHFEAAAAEPETWRVSSHSLPLSGVLVRFLPVPWVWRDLGRSPESGSRIPVVPSHAGLPRTGSADPRGLLHDLVRPEFLLLGCFSATRLQVLYLCAIRGAESWVRGP